jgi:uncharacterized protein YbbK (DUF523 family)
VPDRDSAPPRRSGPDPLPSLVGVSAEDPLVVAVSACLLGQPVGYDGTAFPSDPVQALCALPNVRAVPFCPETFAMGIPRRWMTIHGGDGFAVLDGAARVINVDDEDISEPFVRGATAMLALARREGARLAILTDISPSCGSSVIYDGARLPERAYIASSGVTAALLRRHGLPVVSQRDAATLQALRAALDPTFTPDPAARDHIEGDWYRATFGAGVTAS